MIIVNTETIPGQTIMEVRGLVQGNTVRAKHVGRDLMSGFKNIVGGELTGYTELLTESRREAMDRMTAQALELGANAIVNVRFATSSITAGAAELYADGTPISQNKESLEYFGCGNLQSAAMFAAESLPPLVIGGHQHTPGTWHWRNSRTLFLNSGQDMKAQQPHFLVINIEANQISVRRNAEGKTLTHTLRID
ncbi:MAG: YbjQ family protein [Candidatus Methylacidiphilales bacterium]